MGQKVNPISLRVALKKDWQSRWFTGRDYHQKLTEDIKIRQTVKQLLSTRAGVAKVDLERSTGELIITIHTSKPGIVIGRGGSGTDALKKALSKLTTETVKLNIEEVKSPDLSAQLVADNVASQLERRMAFRRVLKMSVDTIMKAGALGAKVSVSGRLNGAEMARRETVAQGSIPLHTLSANIDYAAAEAQTTYGVIGVKVWVYKKTEER